MEVSDAFRELRREWFRRVLAYRGPEREWESAEQEEERNQSNERNRVIYDQQTEHIIAGNADLPVAPQCTADFCKYHKEQES